MIYCKPVIPRRGWGFGNRLFPWARCRIFSHVNGVPMLSPSWARIPIGPLLRGGIDFRYYRQQLVLMGLFDNKPGDIAGARRLWLDLTAATEPEPPRPDLRIQEQPANGKNRLVLFSGLEGCFEKLLGWEAFLLHELRGIVKPRYRELAGRYARIPIAINVRCANDFRQAPADFEHVPPEHKTPIAWFIECLELLRKAAGSPVDAYVVSDGNAEQLRELLAWPNVHFVRPGCAASDLLTLSRAQVLLASGSSTFSAWAAFLGQMPAITVPGQPLSRWGLASSPRQYVGEFNPRRPDERFLRQAADRIALCAQ